MQKILHITQTDIRSDSRILKEIGALSAAGYAVSALGVVMNVGGSNSSFSSSVKISQIRLRSRGLTFLPRSLMNAFSLCEMVSKLLRSAIKQEPDLVHCHDTLALPLGVIVKLFTRARLVYDAHELESDRNGITRLESWLTLHAERLLWRFVDALIVVSPSIDAWYQDNIGPKPSAIILNSPLISKETIRESDYLRSKFSISSDQKIFIYAGILGPGRGVDLITQAFIQPGITSHVVFLGYGDLADELKRLAADHPNIHVHDAVPHSDVVPIVQSADFGLCLIQNVSLSDYLCLPNKLFEYCFAGVPVLASDFPDIRTLLSEYEIGECCDLDPESIRLAVLRLEETHQPYQFSDVAPLSWQAQERKLIELYQRVLASENL